MPTLHRKIDGLLCERCHYQLKSITSDRCPECGFVVKQRTPPTAPVNELQKRVVGSLVVKILILLLILIFVVPFMPFLIGFFWGLVAPLFS